MASVEQTSQQALYATSAMPTIPAGVPHQAAIVQGAAHKARPRVSTTLWEDENTLCFQVEARGISVARREDNDMINGTKLLNVAGMTRGRRDGMLKAEKDRKVVKIGAMHLKGVWIPFERAASFAQKEGIAELLFPLFVEDIRSYLYRQTNPAGGAEIPLILPGEQKYSPAQQQAQPKVPQQAQQAQAQQPSGATTSASVSAQSTPQQQQQQAQQQQYRSQYPASYVPSPQYGLPQGYNAAMQAAAGSYAQYPQYSNYPQMMYPSQQQQQQPQAQAQAQDYQSQQQMYYPQQGSYQGYDTYQQAQYPYKQKAERSE